MLGKHADHFMLAQMRERVVAITPNAGGRSLQVPDRERPGTAHVMAKAGMMQPGSQRTVSSGYIPGMGAVERPAPAPLPNALPGMSGAMLPGVGCCGMGEITMGKAAAIAAVLAGGYLLLKKSGCC